MPAHAAFDHRSGDGAGANNPDLLTDPDYSAFRAYPGEISDLREPYDPFFDVDWSLSLRGAYGTDNDGERLETLVVPGYTLTHDGLRLDLETTGTAEFVKTFDGTPARLGALRLSAGADYLLDRDTDLSADLALSLTQAGRGDPLVPTDVLVAPLVLDASAELAATRTLGRFTAGLRGRIGRNAYGPSTLNDLSSKDNTENNFSSSEAALRLGFRLSPIVSLFAEGEFGRDVFDIPSSVLMVKTDASSTTLRAGLSGDWGEVLTAEAAIGLSARQLDEASLGRIEATVLDGSFAFRPSRTLTVTGSLGTALGPAGIDSGGIARIETSAALDAKYTVNSWLALRAAANWRQARFSGAPGIETGHGLSVGLDYALGAHAAFTADYAFSYLERPLQMGEASHKVTLGLTLSR